MIRALYMLLGLIAGAMVGSAAGLLLAPESGRQLRADLENYTSQVKKEVQQAAEDRRQELEAQLAHLRGEIISD